MSWIMQSIVVNSLMRDLITPYVFRQSIGVLKYTDCPNAEG